MPNRKATKLTRRNTNEIDAHVGARLRAARTSLGLKHAELAKAMGLTYWQIQKYEDGTDRISASRLYNLSQVLSVPITFFFEDLSPEALGNIPGQDTQSVAVVAATLLDKSQLFNEASHRETLNLLKFYYQIPAQQRHTILQLIKTMAAD